MIPVLRALLPPLPPPPPQLAAAPEPVPGSAEPRYFRACPACLVDAEQGDEWIWFGSRGGCGHGMHPPCWRQYVTHCAIGARGGSQRSGQLRRARVSPGPVSDLPQFCDWGDHAWTPQGIGPSGSSSSNGSSSPGLSPVIAIVLIPRMPRVSFPGHVDREDGRLRAPTDGAGAAGGSGLRAAAPPSQAPAPAEPARARPPPTTRDDLGGPGYAMARVPAADGGRAIYEGGRNDDGSPAATGGTGGAIAGRAPATAAACRVLGGRTAEGPGGLWCASSSRRGSHATARPRSGRW